MSLSEPEILQCLMQVRTRLSAAAWLVVKDPHAAEDLFQNIALRAMTQQTAFESSATLTSWAFVSIRRAAIDWLRRQRREVLGIDEALLEQIEREWQDGASPPSGARIKALQDCLDAAPESARQLVRLRYFEGFSGEEVAVRLGTPLNAIYKRLSRLHQNLRDCIEGKLRATAETA